MTTYVAIFMAAWAAGYVLGYQVWMVKQALTAST